MIEVNDIEQMLYLFGVEFNTTTTKSRTIFDLPMFGVKIFFIGSDDDLTPVMVGGWRIITIRSDNSFEEKKMEIFWELMRSGYMNYLRTEVPRTFKAMIISQGWDKRIIEKRLKIYKEDAKYSYLKELNKWALKESSAYVLSMHPGFFDFLEC